MKEKIIMNISAFLITICLGIFIRDNIITSANVPTSSMEPTVLAGSKIIINRTSYINAEPNRGDIVAFYIQETDDKYYLKRVMALPGETIEGKEGYIYINGEKLEDNDYTNITINNDFGPYTVPNNSYFMLGDNRNNSFDSRYWKYKFVEKSNIIGKAIFVYRPNIYSLT